MCPPGRRCREGTLIFTSPPGAMIELQVRGSQPPWADLGLKLGDTGCMAAREAVPGLETLPRFLYGPFLGLHFGPGTEEAELQPFPRASTTEHSQPPLVVPQSSHSRWKLFSSLPDDRRKGGSWRCSHLLLLHCLEIGAGAQVLKQTQVQPGLPPVLDLPWEAGAQARQGARAPPIALGSSS